MFRLTCISTVIAIVLSAAALAITPPKPYAVGNCEPNLQSYPTISAAVSGVPSGSTILVCPGNYPEQIQINQPLTLKGVLVGGSGAAVVTVPSGGLVQNVTDHFGNGFYYQILVENTPGPVNISDLGVDGTGGDVPAGGNRNFVVGIYYQEASGSVTGVSVRNQTTSFHSGDGIAADTFASPQTISIANSTVHGFDDIGIFARTDNITPTLTASIKSNFVRGAAISGGGVTVGGATGTVQSNDVSDVPQGLGLIRSGVTVTGNIISGNNPGGASVFIEEGSNTLKANRIDAGGQIGVQLVLAGSNTIQSNTIVNSSTGVSGCNNSVSGNTVTGNTITDAVVGITLPAGNVFHPNVFNVVTTAVVTCAN
jgi:hypothetical protein